MPAYDYIDEETGLTITVRRPVADRNKPIVLRRSKTIPDRVGVIIAGSNTTESDFDKKIMRGYHRQECERGSSFRSGHSAETIKKTWRK